MKNNSALSPSWEKVGCAVINRSNSNNNNKGEMNKSTYRVVRASQV
jgi:hypothetical protein